MEDNEEFNKVVENITQLEQQLMAIDIKRYEQEGEEAEREIEGHFARCMNDLAARKEALLGDLNKHISHQKKAANDLQKELSIAIEVRRKMLETGSFAFDNDLKTAETVWKGVVRLPSPQVSDSSIKVELPNSLFELIETHGMVTLKHTGYKSPEEPIPATPSTQTTPPVSVDSIRTLCAESATCSHKLAIAYFSREQYQLSLACFNHAIQIEEKDVYLTNRAYLFHCMSMYKHSLRDAERCIYLDPAYVLAYLRKGAALAALGREDEAVQAYIQGLVIDPSNESLNKALQPIHQKNLEERRKTTLPISTTMLKYWGAGVAVASVCVALHHR